MEEQKSTSTKITNETSFGMTKGDLRLYDEELNPIDFDSYPKMTMTLGEDLDKFQYGYAKITVQETEFSQPVDYLVQVDGLMSCVYSVYAKSLNNLREATIRQKTVRMWGIFKMLFFKIRKKLGIIA